MTNTQPYFVLFGNHVRHLFQTACIGFVAFIVVLLNGCTSSSNPQPKTFRVMTFNIHHGEGVDGKLDLDRIAELIKAADVSLVALQEVDRNLERSQRLDVAAELGKRTGMHSIFSNNHAFAGGHYGNAILSKVPIEKRDHRLLPPSSIEQRGWLKAVVRIHGRPLAFWNTHVDHRPDEAERLQSAAKFAEWIKEEKLPVIFCGDFNSSPESRTHLFLKDSFHDSWEQVGKGPGNTIPVKAPNRRIDYIFYSKNARLEPTRSWVVDTIASDHLPVVVEFQWK